MPDMVGSSTRGPRQSMCLCVSGGFCEQKKKQHPGDVSHVFFSQNIRPLTTRTPRGVVECSNTID